jgi:hypothetical protein
MKTPAEQFARISEFRANGMSIKEAVYKLVDESNGTLSYDAARRAFTREQERLQKTGAAPLGHGAAMFTLNEEMSILATLLGLAQERKAGSIDAVVRVVEAMGMLSRWNRQNEDNDIASLRKRAAAWAKTRVRVWRKAGYITTRSCRKEPQPCLFLRTGFMVV